MLRLTILATLLLYACSDNQADYPQRQMPETFKKNPAAVSAGHELFRDKCASCHGKPSEGRFERAEFFNPPAPDFTDARYREADPAYLYWRIETGKTVEPYRSQGSVMPAWGAHLSEEQVWQIVAYLQARAH
ncbi:MAG: cytochrome c [Desulfuromonadales bacterium]|nr:cytochrome c [Desulfuromonadales bacterium]